MKTHTIHKYHSAHTFFYAYRAPPFSSFVLNPLLYCIGYYWKLFKFRMIYRILQTVVWLDTTIKGRSDVTLYWLISDPCVAIFVSGSKDLILIRLYCTYTSSKILQKAFLKTFTDPDGRLVHACAHPSYNA